MEEIKETLLNKKVNSYLSELKDFQAENELTVKITLNEYRELIKEKSTADYRIKESEKSKYARETENEKLKQENKELEMKLFEYRKIYGELEKIDEKDNIESHIPKID